MGALPRSPATAITLSTLAGLTRCSPIFQTMTWTYGWNSSLPVFYIREERHRVLLYVCAHTVVIYNTFRNKQYHLQVGTLSSPREEAYTCTRSRTHLALAQPALEGVIVGSSMRNWPPVSVCNM